MNPTFFQPVLYTEVAPEAPTPEAFAAPSDPAAAPVVDGLAVAEAPGVDELAAGGGAVCEGCPEGCPECFGGCGEVCCCDADTGGGAGLVFDVAAGEIIFDVVAGDFVFGESSSEPMRGLAWVGVSSLALLLRHQRLPVAVCMGPRFCLDRLGNARRRRHGATQDFRWRRWSGLLL